MALHYVGLNPSAIAYFDDGDPRIRLGTWFYSQGGLNTGWTCDGARVYLPAEVAAGTVVRAYAIRWAGANLPAPGTIDLAGYVRTADAVASGTPGWIDIPWAPLAFSDWPTNLLFIYYEFIGARAGDYLYSASGNNPAAAIQSATLPGLFCVGPGDVDSDARSWFSQTLADTASATAASSGMSVWYGSEPIVNDNAEPPVPTGGATISYAFDVAAGGETPGVPVPEGGASISYAYNVQAGGETPEVDVPEGRATVTWQSNVSVVGVTPPGPTPPVVLDPIAQILDDLKTCLCSQILTDGLPPTCFCGVVPGNEVALDYVGDCDDACGMAWVRLATTYPSTSVGTPIERPGNCSVGIGLEIELGIVRCVDVGENGEPPDLATLEAAAHLQTSDMLAMWRAVACCRQSRDWVIGQYAPYGPEGGLVGGVLALSILVT